MNSIYIHIPFCKYICSYCDFCKKYINKQPVDKYLDYLEKELKTKYNDEPIKTLYIGGGTPSALSLNQLKKLTTIINTINLEKNYEFTIEFNPDDLVEEKLLLIKQMGVNRLSIGVQTVNDELNIQNNRIHTMNQLKTGLKLTKNHIDNISLDFIYNLPNQSIKDIQASLDFISQYDEYITHISYYSLILEQNTILHTKEFVLKDEDIESKWYYYIVEELKNLGFEQYEISNFSKPGWTSKHNQVYWANQEYIGIGLGASGYQKGSRYTNTMALKDYFNKLDAGLLPTMLEEKITNYDYQQEQVLLGLRTTKGIKINTLDNIDYDLKYFNVNNEQISIKPEYFFISNELIVDILDKLDN